MNHLVRLWKEQYGVRTPLEADSWARRLWNRWVIAPVMGSIPGVTMRILSHSRGELVRLLLSGREGGSFRLLRAMYEYEDPQRRGDLLNRLLMQSPGIKAIRNRRTIAQRMLQVCLDVRPANSPALILAVGGGDGSLELEVIASAAQPNVYYCGVDKDERAAAANQQVLDELGLQGRGFVVSGAAAEDCDLPTVVETASRRFDVPFDGADITVCHGITEYLDVGRKTNADLAKFLTSLHRCTRKEGSLLISQSNYRNQIKFLERGLHWHVRLRSEREMSAEMDRAGWQISVCEEEPMGLIAMYLAVKSDGQQLRIDRQEQLRRHRSPVPVQAPHHRRAASLQQQ